MIFRKPYAFFIKNFKLFHFILFALSAILLYRTSVIYNFVKQYVKTSPNVIGKELTDTLFNGYSYVLIIFMIIINIILIAIMIRKVKPFIYYIINIVLYISVLAVFIISNNMVANLEVMLVEPKTVLAVRDILNIARLLQTISVIFYLVRATGFDIKKFDFGRDLHDLNISEEDSEEYEVAVEFQGNEVIRNFKRNARNFKYYYKENQLIINIIVLLSIAATSLIIYLNIDKYGKLYKENDFVSVGMIQLGVKSSYIIENDYKNTKISTNEYELVAVKLSMKSSLEQKISTARAQLVVDGYKYYPIRAYKSKLFDIGNIYEEQQISKEFDDYVFAYRIPKEHSDDLVFEYVDTIEQKRGETKVNSINIKLSPIKIDEQQINEKTYELTNEIDTSDSILSDYKITINNYEIQEKFVKTYENCVNNNECYTFKETIKPLISTNKEKAILKINGTIDYNKKIKDINDLYKYIKYFGSIEYTYNGNTYIEKNDFSVVEFGKNKDDSIYIEVDKDIMYADSIKLSFNIRNYKYTYILRGNV